MKAMIFSNDAFTDSAKRSCLRRDVEFRGFFWGSGIDAIADEDKKSFSFVVDNEDVALSLRSKGFEADRIFVIFGKKGIWDLRRNLKVIRFWQFKVRIREIIFVFSLTYLYLCPSKNPFAR